MSSSQVYKEFILEQLSLLSNITYKPMMGEFLLYYKNVLFGGIYDDRLLIKIIDTNEKFRMQKELPYVGAKPMYLVDTLDDKNLLKNIVIATYEGLVHKK